ncbi:prolyl oligopeptidase family serine peptidase [Bacillus marinisedimentorum]|uniref:prolyl oligopeptidase family serine peptidase n=1 Tax=Bacillus marinisedimentorum TaxID=1821260 RepID=UPI000871B88D|nr:prolyl oligopeptidase family serine peptidase [Bacillus marinisedimentorum]
MIVIKHDRIADIPALHVAAEDAFYSELPLVIFIHGFTSAKEHNLHFAYLLAEEGFRVVLPEALHHGERNEKGLSNSDMGPLFWSIVINEIEEIGAIKNRLEEQGLIDSRIGLAGTSMGGITTYGALTQYDWIRSAVTLMGSPYYRKFAEEQIRYMENNGEELPISHNELQETLDLLDRFDLGQNIEALQERPLLLWHGRQDNVVPYSHSEQFYMEVLDHYGDPGRKLKFISDPQAAHKVSREALLNTVDWFTSHLLAR